MIVTSTTDEDEIMGVLTTVVASTIVPDGGPDLRPSKDAMLEFGNPSTFQDGAFTVEVAGSDTGVIGGSAGYQQWRGRLQITMVREVKGAQLADARRRLKRLQGAVRDRVNSSSELKSLVINWGITDTPTPVKDGDDYYRIELYGSVMFNKSVLGRGC